MKVLLLISILFTVTIISINAKAIAEPQPEAVAESAADSRTVSKKQDKRGVSSLGYGYGSSALGYDNLGLGYGDLGYISQLGLPKVNYINGGSSGLGFGNYGGYSGLNGYPAYSGLSGYSALGRYNPIYGNGYNRGYSGYNGLGGGYSGYNGIGYNGLGSTYSTGLAGYPYTKVIGLAGGSGYSTGYTNPIATSYSQNGGYYY